MSSEDCSTEYSTVVQYSTQYSTVVEYSTQYSTVVQYCTQYSTVVQYSTQYSTVVQYITECTQVTAGCYGGDSEGWFDPWALLQVQCSGTPPCLNEMMELSKHNLLILCF